MQCVTPMFRRYEIGNHKKGVVVPRSEVMQDLEMDPNHIRFALDRMNTLSAKTRYETIPCSKCWACRLNYSAEWATRNMLEAQYHDNNFFITLTYDEEHLPIATYMEYGKDRIMNDGTWEGTLYPEHVTRFINSLRKHFFRQGKTDIKYFYCGEYGETTQRPHYHMILFGADLDVNQFHDFHIDERFKEHWKSYELEKWWPYGMHDIACLEWSCAAYVSRYCMKKLNDEPKSEEWYAYNGKQREFIRMSNRPGIGMRYYKDHVEDIYKNDEMIMKTVKGNTGSFKPPKAFDRKFKESNPEAWDLIQYSRKVSAQRARELQQELSNYTDLQKLSIKAENIITKSKMLPRVGEF